MGGSPCNVDDVTALPSHIQDGGYALLWQRYDNNKMAAICYYGEVILHLQQYSRRLNLFFPDILMKNDVRNWHVNYDMDAQSGHRMVRSGSRQYLTFRLRVKSLSDDYI